MNFVRQAVSGSCHVIRDVYVAAYSARKKARKTVMPSKDRETFVKAELESGFILFEPRFVLNNTRIGIGNPRMVIIAVTPRYQIPDLDS